MTEINSKMTKNQKKRARKKAKRTQELFDLQQKQLQELDMLDELQELEQEIGTNQVLPTSEGDLKEDKNNKVAGTLASVTDTIQMNGETNSNGSEAAIDDDLSIKLNKLDLKKDSVSPSSNEMNEEDEGGDEYKSSNKSQGLQDDNAEGPRTLTTQMSLPGGICELLFTSISFQLGSKVQVMFIQATEWLRASGNLK